MRGPATLVFMAACLVSASAFSVPLVVAGTWELYFNKAQNHPELLTLGLVGSLPIMALLALILGYMHRKEESR